MSYFGHEPGIAEPSVARAILLYKPPKRDWAVYLGKRGPHSRFNKDLWEGPGGKIHPGETFDIALHREIEEETGLVDSERLLTSEDDLFHDIQIEDGRWRMSQFALMLGRGAITLGHTEHSQFALPTYEEALSRYELTPDSQAALIHYRDPIMDFIAQQP